nr:zinc finger CCHC domain-containing protein 7 [Pogona vitticeps]XP_020646995.1 zinc finger CCHC domain-containing protein 7 [Pogona vitticeps]XP_020646996.1 zinc finger CCHC domain-containing protein 7 [Pogona vitticeps]XP_020646997.1 zinc finger CCHC domain-containing protein 7 [Pogona vitticeps]XP_020646999.1 zinc finger CCHC domain-containing protein 7 [Pogona vitticeps]
MMFGEYDDVEAMEDDLYCEESSSETSIDSEVEFHLYSQVHYAQDLEEVIGQEETVKLASAEYQVSVSKHDQKNNFIVISDSDAVHVSDSPDVITLSDTPDEDSIYKSKLQKLMTPASPAPPDTTELISPKPSRGSSRFTLVTKRGITETSKKERTSHKSISFHRDGIRMIHKILVIEDSSSDEHDDVSSIVSESDNVESWMLLGGARDDKDDGILLNLEGCGTSASEGKSAAGWTINDKDLEAQIGNHVPVRHNYRYYSSDKNVICRNCDKRGHLSKNCPVPKKIPPCCLCAQRGHLQNSCPARFCLNCCLPGHFSRECLERMYWKKHCNRCDMRGHYADACPEIWRQYHLTTKPGPLKKASSYQSPLVYCYNCAQKGHYGYECTKKRMFGETFPTFPFIYYYDSEYDMKRNSQRGKKKVQELEEAGLVLKRPRMDNDQRQYSHMKKRRMLKEHDKKRDKCSIKPKKKLQRDTLRRKHKKEAQGDYTIEEDFPRGGRVEKSRKARKCRKPGLQIIGGKMETLQAPPEAPKKQKKKKKRRNYTSNSRTEEDNLFLIKQRKKKSKQSPSC